MRWVDFAIVMESGPLAELLAITATHRAHAWDACAAIGAAAAFAPIGLGRRSKEERRRDALGVAVGIVGAAIGATLLPMALRLPAVIASRSAAPLLVGDRMAFGALIGFAGAAAIVAPRIARVRGGEAAIERWRALDRVAPSLALLVILGRLGCFLEGCDFGSPSSLPWAVRYPAGSHAFEHQLARGLVRATDAAAAAVHPAQLYEALVGIAMLGVAIAVGRARRWREGAALRATLATYALGRLAVEVARGDERGALGPFSVPQWMAIALLAWCAGGLAGSGRSRAE